MNQREPEPGAGPAAISINHKVGHGGLLFDLQTEIVRTDGAHAICSQLYFGGCVVTCRQQDLRDSVDREAASAARALARQQHRQFVIDLRQGALDDEISKTPGTGEFRAITDAVIAEEPKTRRAAQAKRHFGKGLKFLYEAVDEWLEAVELDPTNSRLQGLCDDVFQAFERVRAAASGPAESKSSIARRACAHEYFELGLADARAGRLVQALVAWNWATTLDPTNETIRTNLNALRRQLADMWADGAPKQRSQGEPS